MILTALEMQGFKSFPDKTVLKFDKGITSVVGPNGSGKSNISDAVRWVLGEQSTKNLRGSKMEDVVFSGTRIRKAQGFAEVTLRLDNRDRTLDIDRDEVAVTRRYYRSGESEYKLNGDTVRLRDIHELFMDTGLGRDGYSIVSQGKIADMISAKSTDRREIFEEAAGISLFRHRRTDAMRRLAQAQDNLLRLKDILTELEDRVGPLKEQSEKAEKFLVLAQEKKELEIGLWLNTIDKSRDALREQEHKISLASAQHETAEADLSKIENEFETVTADAQAITVKIEDIRQNISLLDEQAAHLEAQVAVEENSIEHNNEAIQRIVRDKEQASDTEQHLDEQINEALANIGQLELATIEKKDQLETLSHSMQLITQENEQFAEKIADLSREISVLSIKLADGRVTASTTASSIEEIKSRITAVNEMINSRNELLENLRIQRQACEKAVEDCSERVLEISNSLKGYTMRLETRKSKRDKLKSDLDALSLDIEKKSSKIRMLDDLEKNMEGYSGSVKAVMKEAKRGILRGIHGPLSQLIQVQQKYEIAVETAFGAAIQNIVTDDEDSAKRAIKFLKDTNAGRATFLPLTAIKSKPLTENGLEKCQGFVDIASSLVEYDKQYDEIIKAQLSRTVVAETMDHAIVIAKKYNYRFRIVTLDGQIINAGGSMTGGSRGFNAGILSRGNEIIRLREQVSQQQSKLDKLSVDYKTAMEDFAAAQADLEGSQADLTTAQEDKIRAESELRLALGQLESAENAYNELLEEKSNANSRIETLFSSHKAAQDEVIALSAELEQLESDLSKLTGDKESLSAKREKLSEQAANINLEILAVEKDMEALNDVAESLRRRKASHADRVDVLDKEIQVFVEKNTIHTQNITNLRLQAEGLRSQNAQSRKEIENLIAQRNEHEKRSAQLRALERAKSAEREHLSGELARLEERKAAMHREYDDTINKLYDEYQLTRREAEQIGIKIDEPQKAQRRLNEIKSGIRALGSVNVGAIEEYKEVSERFEFMSVQVSDIEKSKEELNRLIDELTSKMAEQFREQFNKINLCFGETFTELFGGGKAELVLEDPQDILECGIEIRVQPKGKNIRNIDLLSGGEKGLSAIALLFAILKVTPSPFCIFDEVEAALDDVNVTRYAQYVRRMTKNTQFILITHRRGTMEESDVLYGVTMQEEGVSKLLELRTADMAKKLGLD